MINRKRSTQPQPWQEAIWAHRQAAMAVTPTLVPYAVDTRAIMFLEFVAWDDTLPLIDRANAVRRIMQLTDDPATPQWPDDTYDWRQATDEELVQTAMDALQCRIEQAEREAGWDPTP